MKYATLFFDGGSRGNPGPSGYGYVLTIPHDDGADDVIHGKGHLDSATNNVAEYSGLIAGIQHALDEGVQHLDIFGDSMLIICQLTGEWQCRKEHLKPYRDDARDRLRWITWTATHVRRAMNSEADALANAAMDKAKPFTIKSPIRSLA